MRRIVTLAIVLAVCASLSACGSSSPSAVPSSSKSVLASVVAAALAQKSVHWTSSGYGENEGIWTWTADVGTNSGTERGVQSRRGTVQIRLVQNTVYVRGSFWQLMRTAGLSEPEARYYARRWITIPRGDSEYGRVADGLTLGSIVRDVTCDTWRGTKLRMVRKKSHGTRFLFFRRTLPKSDGQECRLTARASRTPLPVSSVFSGLGHGSSLHFSKWNEPVHVTAPASSTPIATVRRG